MLSAPFLLTLACLGAIGGFAAGLVGVGGAIIMVPLLLYIPAAIGTGSLEVHEAMAISMVQVFAGSASGLVGHLREGVVDRRLVVTLGSGMMIGSLSGAVASDWLPAQTLKGIFAAMAAAGAVMLFALGEPVARDETGAGTWSAATGFLLALGVGTLAGAIGAGGAFVLIPLMLYVLRIPPRIVIGSSLAVALAGASTGLVGKIATGQVHLWPSLAVVAGALPAAQIGSMVSHRVRTTHLRYVLAALVGVVAIKMGLEVMR